MTPAAQLAEALGKQPKPLKYRNQPVTIDGRRFPSQKEGKRYVALRLMERAGEVVDLELQPRFPLAVNGLHVCEYRADFRYREVKTGNVIVEDVKSAATKADRLYQFKTRLLYALTGIAVREV